MAGFLNGLIASADLSLEPTVMAVPLPSGDLQLSIVLNPEGAIVLSVASVSSPGQTVDVVSSLSLIHI